MVIKETNPGIAVSKVFAAAEQSFELTYSALAFE
jgi:hypothetical protein